MNTKHGAELGAKTNGRAGGKRKPLALIEVMFRGQWTPVYEVADYKAEVGWSMTLSEPIEKIRVVYKWEGQ